MWLKRALTLTLLFGAGFTGFSQYFGIVVTPLLTLPLLMILIFSGTALLVDVFIPGFLQNVQTQWREDSEDPSTIAASLAFLAGQVFPPVAGGSALGLVVSTFVRLVVVETFTLVAVSIGGGVMIGLLMGQIGFGLRVGIITMLVVGMATAGIAIAFLFFAFLGMAWSFTVYLIDWGRGPDDEL